MLVGGFGNVALRRRRPAHAPHRAGRKRHRFQELRLQHLHRAQALAHRLHRQQQLALAFGVRTCAGIDLGRRQLLSFEPGTLTPEEIIGDVRQGLYVTETMGFGVNLVTGDYSQGAAGLWIENGELAYPVEEITIAGNLKDMYRNITAIGNDATFRTASAAPTLRIDGMTIAGGS